MRSASTTPSRTSARASACVACEHLGVLLAHARQIVDVEEAPVVAGDRSMSKNRSRSRGSAQKRLASSVAIWLGTRSSTIPRPAPWAASASSRKRLAAQVLGESRGIDDVVAVGDPRRACTTGTGTGARSRGRAGRGCAPGQRRSRSPGELQAVGGAQRDGERSHQAPASGW